MPSLADALEFAMSKPRGARLLFKGSNSWAVAELERQIHVKKLPLALVLCPYDPKEVWLTKGLKDEKRNKDQGLDPASGGGLEASSTVLSEAGGGGDSEETNPRSCGEIEGENTTEPDFRDH